MFSESLQPTNSPMLHSAAPTVGQSQCAPQHDVSAVRQDLAADELERHIASCGYLMLMAYQRYEDGHCLGDLGEAHRWKLLMEEAIKSRKPAHVRSLERQRGLA